MSEFQTYSKFYAAADAEPFIELLKKENIPFTVEREVNQLDPIYIGASLDPMIAVKIPWHDFARVNKLLESQSAAHDETLDRNYYLYQFTSEELMDVVKKPDEWNPFDVGLARKLLQERGVQIRDAQPPDLHSYKPLRLETHWVVLGYLFTLFVPYGGILAGLGIVYAKKTLRSGRRVQMYDAFSIRHGYILLIFGCMGMAAVLLLRLSPILYLL